MEKNRVVKQILFDVMYKGEEYKDLDFGYHNDKDVTEEYIHSEDGPWAMLEVGDDVIDFQIWADTDEPEILLMSACATEYEEATGIYHHTDFIGSEDIDISNIRVEYEEEEPPKEQKVSVTFYGLSKKEFDSIQSKFEGTYTKSREDNKYDVTIELFKTTDENLAHRIITGKSAFIGLTY